MSVRVDRNVVLVDETDGTELVVSKRDDTGSESYSEFPLQLTTNSGVPGDGSRSLYTSTTDLLEFARQIRETFAADDPV